MIEKYLEIEDKATSLVSRALTDAQQLTFPPINTLFNTILTYMGIDPTKEQEETKAAQQEQIQACLNDPGYCAIISQTPQQQARTFAYNAVERAYQRQTASQLF